MRLRDDLVADDEKHRAGRDAEDHRHRRLGERQGRRADHAGSGLDEAREARDGERDAATVADRKERHGDREPLWDVLQADAEPERDAVRDVTAREADADGHAFREVVQRDRDHEEPQPTELRVLGPLAPTVEVLVRRVAVHEIETARAREHAEYDGERARAYPEEP